MPTDALKRLLHLNLSVASRLGLLETNSPSDLASFALAPIEWKNPKLTPVNRFERAVQAAKFAFQSDWRYRCCQLGAEVQLSRVLALSDLAFVLDATRPRKRVDFAAANFEFENLKNRFSQDYNDPDSAATRDQIARFFVNLRGTIFDHRATPYLANVGGIHSPNYDCWVAQAAESITPSTSQGYRDRLGLHHFPRGTRIGDQMVRLDFRARLSDIPCPSKIDIELRERLSNGLWLIRPTMVHKPNVRFAQGHGKDEVAAAAPGGSTIDIGDDAYQEGEAEFILLAGIKAELQWHDVELLPGGLPVRHVRDDDHQSFSDVMHQRLSRLA